MKLSGSDRKLNPKQEASNPETSAERLSELTKDQKLARLVAANPSTPADLLLKLSQCNDKTTQRTCIANPATPHKALLELGSRFPEQLIENPVFDELITGHPDVFAELPISTINNLLSRNIVPVELIRWAWKNCDDSTIELILLNPSTPPDIIDELCNHKSAEIRIAAELHNSRELPKWARTEREKVKISEISELREQLSIPYSTKLDVVILSLLDSIHGDLLDEFLSIVPEEGLLKFIRSNRLSAQGLEALSKHSSCAIRELVGNNPRTPPRILLNLAKDNSRSVRASVAYTYAKATDKNELFDEAIREEIAILLLNDDDEYVRHWIPMSETLPRGILGSLANDPSDMVREQVAKNRGITMEVMEILVNDSSSRVRYWLGRNTAAPSEILAKIGNDEDIEVRKSVAINFNAPPEVLALLGNDRDTAIKIKVAQNKNSTIQTLENLASDSDNDILHGVGKNGNTSSEIIMLLSRHSSTRVRSGVALNLNASSEVLHQLAGDTSKSVREATAMNKKAPVEVLEKLSQDSVERIRFEVAQNQNSTLTILTKLATDASKYVRSNVAENSSTSIELLELLAQDQSSRVSEQAIQSLKSRNHRQDTLKANDSQKPLPLNEVCDKWCKGVKPSPLRRFLLQLPECPASLLVKHIRSRSWLDRLAIAQNYSTPETALKKLIDDGNRLVQQAAVSNLARCS